MMKHSQPPRKSFLWWAVPAVLVAVLIFLAACASNPMVRWAEGQQVYNGAIAEVIRLREPCVASAKWPAGGPDHQLCFIDDELMRQIALARDNARELLDRAMVAAELGNNLSADNYLAQAELALEDFLFYQLRASTMETRK